MKLLSVAMPQHDVNMSYYDGDEVHYIKLERLKQEKRFKFATLPQWKHEAKAIWGVEEGNIDDFICTFDPIALPSHLQKYLPHNLLARIAKDPSNAERLAPEVCSYLGVGQAWFSSHHYAHALSTWMLESSPPDVQIVIDGLGDGRPWSVYRNQKLVGAGDIRHGSIGWGIREAGKLLGVKYSHYNDIAGKVMGLQSYGQLNADYLSRLHSFGIGQIKDIWSVAHWHRFQGSSVLGQESLLDWVTTVHQRTGELILELFRQFAAPGEKLSYSGGVAQNVLWNSAIRTHFPHVIIPPHASDEGLSLGGLEWLRKKHGLGAFAVHGFPYIQSDTAVAEPSDDTINKAAQLLAQGKVVGWYQGHGEAGPRALGNRSILMDPRLDQGKERINSVKMRENYRPFGASVLKERFGDFFDGHADPFMLYACHLKGDAFPAIRHVDGSCRVQLVDQGNPVFNQLLARFNEITGCPLLLNTSLNLAGKPIAADPAHARQFFDETALDAMCMGDEILCK